MRKKSEEEFILTKYILLYRKSSNNSSGAYLPTKIFWVGAYSSGGLINLEE